MQSEVIQHRFEINFNHSNNGCINLCIMFYIHISEGSKSSTHYLSDTDSTFREKALRRELVWGIGESTRVFIQVNILKQHVTK